jgi:hypothetical protein
MHVKNRFGWIALLALVGSGLSACGGGDAASDDASGSQRAELVSRETCAEMGEGECATAPTFCGGIGGIPCAAGQTCVDDPSDDCDAKHGGSDCGGICVDKPKPAVCGGFGGFPCPNGQTCVDDPSDDCDPKHGGSDCSGVCIYARRTW